MADRTDTKKHVTARIDPVAFERLEELSTQRDRTVSYLINAAVVAYVQAREAKAEPE